MLHTNKKIVLDRFIDHILSFYEGDKNALHCDGEAGGYGLSLDYKKGYRLAEGGCFLCYNDQMAEFLKTALEENDNEASKFSPDQVFTQYCHLCGRAYEKIFSK